jgi:hypothetical protein
MTGIPDLLRIVLLSLSLTLTLFAGVTYDQTVRTGNLDSAQLLKSRVPSIDLPVFDISPILYAPPLGRAPTDSFRILVEGDRLVRIGKDVSTIFDLKARTVTVVQLKGHAYSVETLDEAQQRLGEMLREWRPPIGTTGKFTTEVQKTGQTRQIQGQTAEEYRIIAIGVRMGKSVVAGSSIYWMVPKPPSDELAAFQLRWSSECDLPFPGMPPTGADPSVFGAMARAASKLAGYPILYVVESRPMPFPGLERVTAAPEYNASRNSLPDMQPDWNPYSTKIDVTETAFSGFVAGAVDPSAFAVPAGYKKKTGRRYLLDLD